jgi:hypothetical protein
MSNSNTHAADRSNDLVGGAGAPEEGWSPCTISVALTRRSRAVDRVAPGFGPSGSEDVSSGPFFFCPIFYFRWATIDVMSRSSFCRSMFFFLSTFSLVACLDKPYDADGPGDFIGVFAVDAKQDANTCGAGAQGAPETWSFEVRLSREIGIIYWNPGTDGVTGKLDADKHSFAFDATIVVDKRDANSAPWLPPCSVSRHDRSSGKIADDDESFTGKLTYDWAPTIGSDCTDLVMSDVAEFAALPCGMTYTLDAKRTSTTP